MAIGTETYRVRTDGAVIQLYNGATLVQSVSATPGIVRLVYDGTKVRVLNDGLEIIIQSATAGQKLFPKVSPYNTGVRIYDIKAGPAGLQPQIGTTLTTSTGGATSDPAILNSAVTITAGGVLSGAGGGTVTIGALTPNGVDDLADGTTYKRFQLVERNKLTGVATGATVGAIAGTNLLDSGFQTLTDALIKNSAVTISAGGVLTGAGGGTVTYGGLGGGAVGQQVDLRFGGLYLKDSAGTVLGDANVKNSAITVSAGGVLSGAGGGTVTIGGLGFLGDLNATRNRVARQATDPGYTEDLSEWVDTSSTMTRRRIRFAGAWYVGATDGAQSGTNLLDSTAVSLVDTAIKNSAVTLSAAGVLSGAGGGTVNALNLLNGPSAAGADVTSAQFPSIVGSGAFAIAANSSGVITTTLPFTRQFTAKQGTTDVSATTNWVLGGGYDTLGLTLDNTANSATRGQVTVNVKQITATTVNSTGSGTATLTATTPNGSTTSINLVFTKTNAPVVSGGGTGAASGAWSTMSNPASTVSAAISTEIIVRSDGTGKIKVLMDITYTGSGGSSTKTFLCNVAYATTSGGALTDLFSDTDAAISITPDNYDITIKAWSGAGSVYMALTQFTMPAANTDYYFKVKGRYSASNIIINYTNINVQQV